MEMCSGFLLTMSQTYTMCFTPNLELPCAKVGVSYNDFIFPLGKMIGMVWLRTSFILSSRSWDIGSLLTGSAGRMKLSCVMPALVTHL